MKYTFWVALGTVVFFQGCGTPTLHMAVEQNDFFLARKLVKEGCDLEERSHNSKRRPLEVAIDCGHFELFEWLIGKGADFKSDHPIRRAIKRKSVKIVKYLLDRGLDFEDSDEEGFRLLHRAVKSGCLEIVECLLEQGADPCSVYPFQENRASGTPLHLAARFGSPAIVDVLVKAGAKVNQMVREEMTPLAIAAERANLKTIATLLRHGADLEGVCPKGQAALQCALYGAYSALFRKRRFRGGLVRIEIRTSQGTRVLRQRTAEEVEDDYHKAIQLLLRAGAKVNALDDDGKSPMDLAQSLIRDKLSLKIPHLIKKAGGKLGRELKGE